MPCPSAPVYASHGYERSHVDGVELLVRMPTFSVQSGLCMHIHALLTCVVPFLLADAAKIVVATVLVNRLDKIVKL